MQKSKLFDVRDVTSEDCLFISLNLRSIERFETFDTLLLPDEDWEIVLADFIYTLVQQSLASDVYLDPVTGKPFAIAFVSQTTKTAASIQFLATPDIRSRFNAMQEYFGEKVVRIMDEFNLSRIECRALDKPSHISWLTSIGAIVECRVPGFSKHDFVQLAWTPEG